MAASSLRSEVHGDWSLQNAGLKRYTCWKRRGNKCLRIWSFFFFSSRRRHTRCGRDWSSDVCSSDLHQPPTRGLVERHTDSKIDQDNGDDVHGDEEWDKRQEQRSYHCTLGLCPPDCARRASSRQSGDQRRRHADVTVHTREAAVTWWGPPGLAPLSRLRPRPLAATFLPGREAAAIRRTRAGCLGRGGSVRTAPTDGPPFPAGRGP